MKENPTHDVAFADKQAAQHAAGLSAVSARVIVPMLFTPGCSAQGEGGAPVTAPASGKGAPVVFRRKHFCVADINVHDAHPAPAMHAAQHAPGSAACVGGAMMAPSTLTPCVALQGEGCVPDVAPGSATGAPVVFFKKHFPVASTNVNATHLKVALAHAPQQAPALAAATGGAAMVPMELTPGESWQEGPGAPTAPEITAGSGVSGSSLSFR